MLGVTTQNYKSLAEAWHMSPYIAYLMSFESVKHASETFAHMNMSHSIIFAGLMITEHSPYQHHILT